MIRRTVSFRGRISSQLGTMTNILNDIFKKNVELSQKKKVVIKLYSLTILLFKRLFYVNSFLKA